MNKGQKVALATLALEHDSQCLIVTQAVPIDPWKAELSEAERAQQLYVTRREFARGSDVAQHHGNWDEWRTARQTEIQPVPRSFLAPR